MAVASNIRLFLKFSLVGCTNVIVTLTAFYILYDLLTFNYLVGSVFAYSLGIVNSFTWNRLWTFRTRKADVKREFVRFFTVNLVGLGMNACIMYLLVDIICTNAFVAQVVAIGFVLIFNFSLARYWVFPNVS
jgi:putative flippase GtrA